MSEKEEDKSKAQDKNSVMEEMATSLIAVLSLGMSKDRRWLINVYELLFLYLGLLSFVQTPTFRYIYSMSFGYSSVLTEVEPFFKALVLWLVPFAYTNIFGVSPVYSCILKIKNKANEGRDRRNERVFGDGGRISAPSMGIPPVTEDKKNNSEVYLLDLISSSNKLAGDIFRRGGVYLFFGVIFSFGGMLFFYSQSHGVNLSLPITLQLLALVPKVGILIFIELISFFFLKQYRVSMDEFRHFEAIKRSREETLAIVKLVSSGDEKVDFMALLDKLHFSSGVGRLDSGQTTELLESRKMDKDEFEFLTKIVEAVIKRNDKSG
ncbi:hypothetical protein SK44_03492 [Klebsiella aerogenes]|uniref:hypothetical protein n=1 Tax=Klebsiella aerogenes TaxID=548 RepID=UPI00065925E6|nr:hypothetical protein [Klebsiella aerogenes]KLW00224.1 hypothetical protein SK43_03323 [Klebsiella aerogenes]KLW15706.1 hypothetical protein SK44_03492 [Klebsiella aerogenes]